jgi:hypothetical protein
VPWKKSRKDLRKVLRNGKRYKEMNESSVFVVEGLKEKLREVDKRYAPITLNLGRNVDKI